MLRDPVDPSVVQDPIPALHPVGRNRLLDLLPEDERQRLTAMMEHVRAEHGQVICERGEPITHVTFPLRGVVSVVIEMEQGGTAEIGTIGNEGMVGLALFYGSRVSPRKAFNQMPGEALRMSADAFVEEMQRSATLQDVIRKYALGYLNQVAQTAACNRLHAVEQRLCRWILLCQDRLGSNVIDLTQQFLAQMLGVRRASVTVAAARLQKAGLISYRRGTIEVRDRARLVETSCECYATVRREYEKLLG
jgi:CRP-like cAMP-binding protein